MVSIGTLGEAKFTVRVGSYNREETTGERAFLGCVFYEETDEYLAHCLEFDLVAPRLGGLSRTLWASRRGLSR